MRRKTVTILALALALMLVLTGCMRVDAVVDIDENGAATVSGTFGISETAVTVLGQSPEDVLGTADYTVQYVDGVKFYMADASQSYDDIEDVDMGYFDESDLPDSDSYTVYRVEGGYGLNVYIAPRDSGSSGDFGILGSDGSMIDLTAGQSTVFEVRTPYPARQVKGTAVSGITVEGNSVKVDLEKLAEHGEAYYSFLFIDDSTVTPDAAFSDVPAGEWFAEAVQWAADNGYIVGNNGKFSPYDNLTRGAIFTILARMDDVDTKGSAPWYQVGLDWAVENGVSYGENPEGNITREQLIVMLWRYEDEPDADTSVLDSYSDSASIDTWPGFPEAMAWAVETGIIQGGGNKLNPLADTTRAEGAMILQRYCEKLGK